MKMVMAIIKPFKLEEVRQALDLRAALQDLGDECGSAGLLDFLAHLLQGAPIARRQRDLGAVFGQPQRGRLADAGRAARDENGLIAQRFHAEMIRTTVRQDSHLVIFGRR